MRNIDGISKIKFKNSKPILKVKKQPVEEVFYTEFLVAPRLGKKHATARHLPESQATVGGVYSIQLKIRQQFSVALKFFAKQFIQFLVELKKFNGLKKAVPVYAIMIALVFAFSGGAWTALNTQKIEAENIEQTQAGSIPFEAVGNLGPISNVSNDVLYNMTIGQLENYLNSVAEQSRTKKAAEIMTNRKTKLYAYLSAKNTPFAGVSEIIAEQKHWKLILAISFAESTFGRNCVDNNCSNIGVKPGHPHWRKYSSLGDWVKDFDSLLERKYKNWTLEQMNGVYVQPKNPNWMAATRQILEDLQELEIE